MSGFEPNFNVVVRKEVLQYCELYAMMRDAVVVSL